MAGMQLLISPRAAALLTALAKQSDVDYDKRSKEEMMMIIAEAASAGVIPPSAKDYLDDMRGIAGEEFKAISALIPKGQSILDMYILDRIQKRLQELIPKVPEIPADAALKEVYFGTLELGTPAAQVVQIENSSEWLVVISRGLWIASSLASCVIANHVELNPFVVAPVNWKRDPDPAGLPLIEMVDRSLLGVAVEYQYPVFDELHKLFWEFLDSGMKNFIFGHEYAHVLLGHVHAGQPEEDFRMQWNQELMADLTAIRFGMLDKTVEDHAISSIFTKRDPSEAVEDYRHALAAVHNFYVAAGAVLVLYLFRRMEGLRGVQVSRASHPPVQMRINNIWTFVRMELEPDVFEELFRYANLMIRSFLQLLPPLQGSWRDRFEEAALRPLMFHDIDAVIEAIDMVNTDARLADPSLEQVREHLTSLFQDPSAGYEEKYSFLETCLEMVRTFRGVDPLRSIKERIKK
ncbi:hypothetical protein L4X63_11860 [Geomonas sp. Red32]|uniref:hypothetical protein n=1 Tax=Geomonas sp. Red32 TaxID=2912856 RepID=UPI00202D035D|nr:hypothetical protein [Geomonas sp. Red32]MCM0082285.1 hypothetical protein [Geomonas sp. Red32]